MNDEDRKRAEEYLSSHVNPEWLLRSDGEAKFVTDCLVDTYLAGLEEGRKSQWVKCSERLPDSDGTYLVWPRGKYHGHEVQFATVGFNRVPADSFFYETEDSYDTSCHPIQPEYWMPLPPPPAEDKS